MYIAYLNKIINYSLEVKWAIITAFLLLAISIGSYAIRRKISIKILSLLLFSFLVIQILPKVLDWIFALGQDSFSELSNLDIQDAWFYLTTLGTVFSPPEGMKSILLTIIWLFMLIVLLLLFLYSNRIVVIFGKASFYLFFLLLLILILKVQAHYSENSEHYNKISRNFSIGSDVTISRNMTESPDIIVYIGESTSVLNMSLYGYPRNTTPRLSKTSKEDGFIKFDNIFSTHTHTSESLLKALSVATTRENDYTKSIHEDKRLSIVDILENTGIEVLWASNQSQSGSWSLASSIVAKNASKVEWSSHEIYSLFSNANINFRYDDEFFDDVLNKNLKNKVTFLHSIAGHGLYRDYIPLNFRGDVDTYYKNKELSSIFGDKHIKPTKLLLDEVEGYDAAIKYIDYSVSRILNEKVLNSDKEKIFIYFSDHGESVFTDRAHDSSRFVFEMATVPLIVVFNKAAKEKYPDKFKELKKLSELKQVKTLEMVSKIISFIYDIRINNEYVNLESFVKNEMADTIVVRDTISGKKGISLSTQSYKDRKNIEYINDSSMNHLLNNLSIDKTNEAIVCHHRSNSIASSLRGLNASNCIEIDIVVGENDINVYHPPKRNHNLRLSTIFNLMKDRGSSVWLDSKNIDNPKSCKSLSYFLHDMSRKEKLPNRVLVEFPSNTDFSNKKIIECSKGLSDIVDLAYYVPHGTGGECIKALRENNTMHSVLSTNKFCSSFMDKIDIAIKSGYITEISFDYGLKDIVMLIRDKYDIKMNTWSVSSDNLNEVIHDNNYHMVLPKRHDINYY